MTRLITSAVLVAAGATQAKADEILDSMKLAAALYGVDTELRVAHFLAQVGHESGGFRYVREIWGPTAAQSRYEGRADLGNVHQGDGIRFCGRSYIQTTGRKNYAALRDRLRQRLDDVPDFENHPEELEQTPWCAIAAFDYWDMRNLNALADADNLDAISDLVNIGHKTATVGDANGFADRRKRLGAIKAAMLAAPEPAPLAAPVKPAESGIPPNPFVSDTPAAPPAEIAAFAAFPDDALIETALAPSQETPMALPLLLPVALQALSSLVPQLASVFGSGSDIQQRNVKAATVVIEAAKQAAGAMNEQELIEKVQAGDPAIVQAVTEAVKTVYFEVVEAGGGGIAAARAMNEKAAGQPGGAGFFTPAFALACLLLPLVYMTVYFVLNGEFASEVKSMVIAAVVSGILGALTGFFFGSSFSSQRKDARPT